MNPRGLDKNKVTENAAVVLIAGASARAAAQSALRAGIEPVCLDLFADEDLQRMARVIRLENYPREICDVAKTLPESPWMYVGALENHPGLISEISMDRPLWGNSADVVKKVRNPLRIRSSLLEAGLYVPDVRLPDVRMGENLPPGDGNWLLKPIHGAAGWGICEWNDTDDSSLLSELSETYYFQERISGIPMSALYLGMGKDVVMIGVSRQLVGERLFGAKSFQYCGSIGPLSVSDSISRQLVRTGKVFSENFRLRGLFGVDFMCAGEDVFPVELNPRYTASVEVYELAAKVALLEWHIRACQSFENEDASLELSREIRSSRVFPVVSGNVVGKAILYATETIHVPDLSKWNQKNAKSIPFLADIPAAGTSIEAGHPICTLFASAENEHDCGEELFRNSDNVRTILSQCLR